MLVVCRKSTLFERLPRYVTWPRMSPQESYHSRIHSCPW